MKIDVRTFIGFIPLALADDFSSIANIQKPVGKLRTDFVDALNKEIEAIHNGEFPGATDEPLVKTPLMKLLWKHKVEGAHRINRLAKYPELEEAVDYLESEFKALLSKHLKMADGIDSKMTYKQQYLLEGIIERVRDWEKLV